LPSAKLRTPRLPRRLLARPNLSERLLQWSDHRLTLIIAPAGYGKSTLAASACRSQTGKAAASPAHHLWLALDEDDDDPVRFVHSLSVALAPLIPESAERASLLCFSREETQQAIFLLLAALEALATPVLVILDDFHRIQSPEVHQLMSMALERSPDNLHWMILTRERLPISLGPLRLAGQVLEFTVNDLRLNQAEMSAYLKQHGLQTGEGAAISELEQRTQGWLAGLHLAILSLQQPVPGHHADQASEMEALLQHLRGDQFLMADYLAGEVLNRLTDPLRSFLLRCSILEQLTPDLCSAVTGIDESALLLHQAVSLQLFIRPLDETGEWYQQHHLFRDLLRHRLHLEESSQTIQTLYRQAADWHRSQGDLVAALRALVTGGLTHLAADLVQSHAHQAVIENYQSELRQWFALLPDAEIDARPRLILDLAWLQILRGEDPQDPLTRLREPQSMPPGWQDEWAALHLIRRYHFGPWDRLYEDCLATVAQFQEESHLARGWLYMLARLLWSKSGGKAESTRHFQKAEEAFRAVGFVRGQIYIPAIQMQEDLHRADHQALLQRHQQGIRLIDGQARADPHDRLYFDATAGESLYWQNRLPEAAAYFEQVWANAQIYQQSLFILQAYALLSLCARGESSLAPPPPIPPERYAEYWQQLIDIPGHLGPRAGLYYWELLLHIAQGAPTLHLHKLQRLGVTLDSLPENAPDLAWMCLLTAYVNFGYELEALTPHLEMMRRRGNAVQSPYLTIRVDLLRSYQLMQLGEQSKARSLLRATLPQVEATGYVRMVLDLPGLAPLLAQAGSQYAQWLLAQMTAEASQTPDVPSFTNREKSLIGLLREGATGSEIAERLVLSLATVRSHLSRLYTKLGVKNHAQAVAWVRKHGL
jgi:LuxR family maltose regulon positive regulatory protein